MSRSASRRRSTERSCPSTTRCWCAARRDRRGHDRGGHAADRHRSTRRRRRQYRRCGRLQARHHRRQLPSWEHRLHRGTHHRTDDVPCAPDNPEPTASSRPASGIDSLKGIELRGKTLGVVGLGKIGGAIADRAGAPDDDPRSVLYAVVEAAANDWIELVALDALLARGRTSSPCTSRRRRRHGRPRRSPPRWLSARRPAALLLNCRPRRR